MERKWWTLIVVCTGTFMLLLDITIVNVALPKIAVDLKASFTDIQWVIDAYALTLAAVLLSAGVLADLFGRRLLFSIGLLLFAFTSLLCALAPSSLFLILARAGQGLGGAIIFSTSLSLLVQEFHGRERGTALGAWGATIGGATAIGPLLGGGLTEAFGWPSIFLINVPIGIAAAALCMSKVAESRDPRGRSVDWAGTATFTGALFLLVFAVIRGNALGWGSTTIIVLFAGAAVLLVAFGVVETRQERAMLDLTLFRKPTFTGASIVAFALSSSMFAMFLYLTLYLQTILGLSPLQAGLRFLPFTLLSFVVAAISGNLSARVPVRFLLGLGLLLTGTGMLLMRGLTAGSDWTALLPGFIVAGAGVGLANPALASTAVGVVAPQRSGMASGINSTFRQVGIATGIAVLGAIFESSIASRLSVHLGGTQTAGRPGELSHAIAAGGAQQVLSGISAADRARATAMIHVAFTGALNEILLVAGIVAVVGAGFGLVLVRTGDFVASQRPTEAAAAAA